MKCVCYVTTDVRLHYAYEKKLMEFHGNLWWVSENRVGDLIHLLLLYTCACYHLCGCLFWLREPERAMSSANDRPAQLRVACRRTNASTTPDGVSLN